MKSMTCIAAVLLLFGLCYASSAFAKAPSAYELEAIVTNEQQEPLIGATVTTKEATFIGLTDERGRIMLTDLPYNAVLVFDYLGYQTKKMTLLQIRQNNGSVVLIPTPDLLPTAVVIGRRDERPQEIPYTLATTSKEEILFSQAQTPADALQLNENVHVQKSQMGGGSPNIRGFEANKILLVVDGVRMNNAIFRGGHLQNSITLDNNVLEQIEVIYGPGSLNYGSDALGGVVHFRTRDPLLPDQGSNQTEVRETQLFSRYSTANNERTVHANVSYGKGNVGSLTALSFSAYGDLEAGSKRPAAYPDFGSRPFYARRVGDEDQIVSNPNPDVQIYTGYQQFDFLQKIKIQKRPEVFHLLNFQYSNTSDVPRYDALTETENGELRFIDWYYGPQQRVFGSWKTQVTKPTLFADKATIIAAYQKIDEDRYDRRLRNARRTFDLQDVHVFSLTADADKFLNDRKTARLTYGVDAQHDRVISDAGTINVRTNQVLRNENTRYPSNGSQMTTVAGYGNFKYITPSERFSWFAGLRYSYVALNTRFGETDPIAWPTSFFVQGLSSVNTAFNWSTGITLRPLPSWEVRLLASTAFHAPNVDDWAKFRERNNFISVPNPDLGPEKALNGELALSKSFGDWNRKNTSALRLSVAGFYTQLTDAIVRDEFALQNGDTTIISNAESFRIVANVNADKAYVYGGSANLDVRLGSSWTLASSYNYTYGRFQLPGGVEEPISHIPPVFGRTSLGYQNERFKIAGIIRYNGWKHIEDYADPGSDNPEYATPDGTYAWTTYSVNSSWFLSEKLRLDLSVENITDLHYRVFASGVSAPGRNFIVAFKATL